MKISVQREVLLKPLQLTVGAIERRQTLPVLSHFLLSVRDGILSITATDMEIELLASVAVHMAEEGEVSVPGRKLVDICRSLPEEADITLSSVDAKVLLQSGRSRFTLATLPVGDFPALDDMVIKQRFEIRQSDLQKAINRTAFSMAQQDVRYYLNGLLLEVSEQQLRCVSTDGHRLSLCTVDLDAGIAEPACAIVPRKGVNELSRLLQDSGKQVEFQLSTNHVRVVLPDVRFTSKVIDGKFPDYNRVLPEGNDKTATADRQMLIETLSRIAILSNEKYKGVRLIFSRQNLQIKTHNPDEEEAEDEVAIEYDHDEIDVGFNVAYLLDIFNKTAGTSIRLHLRDSNSSCLITETDNDDSKYVVMPMRL